MWVVEGWFLAVKILTFLSLSLQAFLVLFPLLPTSIFLSLLSIQSTFLALMLSLFMSVLLFKHRSVSLIFTPLIFFILTTSGFSFFTPSVLLFLFALSFGCL